MNERGEGFPPPRKNGRCCCCCWPGGATADRGVFKVEEAALSSKRPNPTLADEEASLFPADSIPARLMELPLPEPGGGGGVAAQAPGKDGRTPPAAAGGGVALGGHDRLPTCAVLMLLLPEASAEGSLGLGCENCSILVVSRTHTTPAALALPRRCRRRLLSVSVCGVVKTIGVVYHRHC